MSFMTVIYQATASESPETIDSVATANNLSVQAETETHYATLWTASGTLPSSIALVNSGEVQGEELVGGVIPQRPK